MNPDSFPGVRAFARYMLRDDRLLIRPLFDSLTPFKNVALHAVLFREACWQVELIVLLPNVSVPRHRHNRVESADLMLSGGGVARVAANSNAAKPRGRLLANLVRVPRGEWHEGSSGPNGVVYLSFQKWHEGPMGAITEDWEDGHA